ncbi:MAG: hypothetical protein LQ341_000162 [Variospora aurantia]|nr:MAG: hypothetical protein LQ341_000162 [Variospora aurantia]
MARPEMQKLLKEVSGIFVEKGTLEEDSMEETTVEEDRKRRSGAQRKKSNEAKAQEKEADFRAQQEKEYLEAEAPLEADRVSAIPAELYGIFNDRRDTQTTRSTRPEPLLALRRPGSMYGDALAYIAILGDVAITGGIGAGDLHCRHAEASGISTRAE